MAASSVRFGAGVTREVGMDLGARRPARAGRHRPDGARGCPRCRPSLESLEAAGVAFDVYDRVRVEPTDESFLDAIAFARRVNVDAFVAVGGGSTIDTAKAVNLYTTYPPADFLDYVNPPIGKGLPVPGPLKPLIAIPTTAGTGSETTGVSIFDLTRAARQDRHRQPPAEADARPARSREHADDAAAGRRVERARHPEPRVESFTAMPFTGAAAAGSSGAAAGLSGIESDQRHLVAAGAADGGAVPRPRGRRPVRRRGARAACCWRRRTPASGSATPACTCRTACRIRCRATCKSYRAPGYAVGSSARAARHLGDPQRAGGVPLHGVGRIPSVICRRPRRSAPTCQARQAADAGEILADRITWFMQRLQSAERAARRRLHVRGHPGAGRRHAAAAPRDEAVAAAGGTGRSRAAVRGGDGRVVACPERAAASRREPEEYRWTHFARTCFMR